MNIKNHLQFKKSKIYPDNSHIRWEIDGKGFIGNKQVFQLHSNDNFNWLDDSCFVSVLNPGTNYGLIDSPLFWNTTEQGKGVNIQLSDQWKYNDRRAAMQWAEDYLMKSVTNQLSTT